MQETLQTRWSWIEGTQAMRLTLLDSLNEADLAFNPGGQNLTLGALCREIGEIQYSYIRSLQNFKQDWSYRNNETGIESSISQLKTWYVTLDNELKATLEAFSAEDVAKTIDRGGGFVIPVDIQLDIYLQALLIFFGKASVYLKALNKPLQQMAEWIG